MSGGKQSGCSGRPRPIVAVDGPAGAGKSTVARLLSERLGFTLLDTGALYRGIALTARRLNIGWDQPDLLAAMAEKLELGFDAAPGAAPRLLINGEDCSEKIRSPEISRGASQVSQHPQVRARLLALQRKLGDRGGVVVEGRDIGTVVFPDAEVKIFLTASPEVRARRRFVELRQAGVRTEPETVLQEIRERDARDQQRAAAPLKPADDAVVVDTSDMSLEEVVEYLANIID